MVNLMTDKEFNNWLEIKNRRLTNAEERIEAVLEQIKRLAEGEHIDIVLGGQNGK